MCRDLVELGGSVFEHLKENGPTTPIVLPLGLLSIKQEWLGGGVWQLFGQN